MNKSVVKEIGPLVPSFEAEKVVVLFGTSAPAELREMSVIHEQEEPSVDAIHLGGTFSVDDTKYSITAVGKLANKNYNELGHISIYFQEPPEEVLPGAVYVSPFEFPSFQEGTILSFNK